MTYLVFIVVKLLTNAIVVNDAIKLYETILIRITTGCPPRKEIAKNQKGLIMMRRIQISEEKKR